MSDKTTKQRPSWDNYFMTIAHCVSSRTTCIRRSVGAVVVKDKRILATGYNGVPTGLKHCKEYGCIREQNHIPSGQRHEMCRGLHAEQNAIIQAAKTGTNLSDSILYCTTFPCIVCAKMLINTGIKEVVYTTPYPDKLSASVLDEAGIKLRFLENFRPIKLEISG